ncbi:signal transduction histidine kinase [Kribbella antiqua]|uniref:histidine kinase n=1 Tax=Kribbella antiqua TaxID=2512217 RepID=A0A4R2J2F4_9ACTN|nr:sensor domain-containing protein [Kribbella antiqua]TCO49495.1 signal transduction histidine kinase [Kribbella antiqua]
MSSVASPVPRAPWRLWRSPYLWLATIHLLGDAVVVFTSGVLVLLAVAVVIVGFPLAYVGLPLTVWANRCVYAVAGWERARAWITRGQLILPLPPPPPTGSRIRDARAALFDHGLWRQLLYYELLLPMAMTWIVAIVVAWSVPPVLIGLPLYYSKFAAGQAELGPFVIDTMTRACVAAVIGLVFLLVVSPWLMRTLSALDGKLAQALLGRSEKGALAERVTQLVTSRQQVVDSVEGERRRMERDLHDGAQQRLVSLAMTLGRAKNRLGDKDPAVRTLLDEAHGEALQAIADIRDLTRGLHPPVLTDRGLDAAISAVAARSPVPVRVTVDVEQRPSLTIESIAYFVVTEALTNVAKHAAAAQAEVRIRRYGDVLRVEVEDDGQGGADPALGSGLRGLSDRVAGVDGRLRVTSPPGGPTLLTAEVPCGGPRGSA